MQLQQRFLTTTGKTECIPKGPTQISRFIHIPNASQLLHQSACCPLSQTRTYMSLADHHGGAASWAVHVLSNDLWSLTDRPCSLGASDTPLREVSKSIKATGWISAETPHYLFRGTPISSNWFYKCCSIHRMRDKGSGTMLCARNCPFLLCKVSQTSQRNIAIKGTC